MEKPTTKGTEIAGLYGLVLTGGRSSRMGTDKGSINYYGIPQREYLYHLLGRFCEKVFISCKQEQIENIDPAFNPLADKHPFESPLNGILTAMETHSDRAWLIAATDMIYVDLDLLMQLVNERDATSQVTVFNDTDQKLPEPMLAIWEPTAYDLVKKEADSGNLSPRNIILKSNHKLLTAEDERKLVNINEPSEAITLPDEPYVPISCSFYDILEESATKNSPVGIQYFDDTGQPQSKRGIIKDLITRESREYMILDSGDTIRLDRVISVNGISPKSFC